MKNLLFLSGFALHVFNTRQRKNDNPPIFLRKNLGGYNARTIPPFGIFLLESEKDNELLIQHELEHWKQYQELGLANYYARYAREYAQHGYDGMPMELAARFMEDEYCRANYTECVRNGKAKTVNNPKFRL